MNLYDGETKEDRLGLGFSEVIAFWELDVDETRIFCVRIVWSFVLLDYWTHLLFAKQSHYIFFC